MNNLTIKNVDVFGDMVIAAQDENGVIWAGVSWICNGIGLTEGQLKSERKKIQEDLVLSKGGRKFVLPSNGSRDINRHAEDKSIILHSMNTDVLRTFYLRVRNLERTVKFTICQAILTRFIS